MTEEQFRSEILNYVGEEYDRYLEIRQVIGEMMRIFHCLCDQNDIPYCMAYGSLLGEIRDGGAIPWDPDMDVIIPIDQLEKLLRVLETQLPDGYFFESNVINPHYPYFESRIGKKGYPTGWVHLDIFYLLAVPSGMDPKVFSDRIKKLFHQRANWFQAGLSFSESGSETKVGYYARKVLYRVRSHFRTGRSLDREFRKLSQAGDYSSAQWLCAMGDMGELYSRDLMEPMEVRMLNGKEMGLPHNPIGVLNTVYSDYQKYYPIANRYQEFYDWMRAYRKLTGEQQKIHYYR